MQPAHRPEGGAAASICRHPKFPSTSAVRASLARRLRRLGPEAGRLGPGRQAGPQADFHSLALVGPELSGNTHPLVMQRGPAF